MYRTVVSLASVVLVFGLMSTASHGQLLGLYEFDAGGNGTSWNDAANWEQVLDPNGLPINGDPAAPPAPVTSADIPLLGVVLVDNTQAGQTALNVSVGTAAGAGSLTISGGDLTVKDMWVGTDAGGINLGILAMTGGSLIAGDDIELGKGSVGVMTMSGGAASTGDDFFIRTNSSLTMNGGTIDIGDRLVMEDNAGLILNGGDIVANDDFFFFGNSQITVNGGSMIVKDKMRFDGDPAKNGKLTINDGLVRSNEFSLNITDITDFRGVVEINGDGVYQVEQGDGSTISSLTVAQAQALVDEGVHFVTSEGGPLRLGVSTVIVADFFGKTNVAFTQISVIPEPTSMLLLSLGGLGLMLRRRSI